MTLNNFDLKKLGQRIKDQRNRRRLTQSDIANALQISAQAVSKWERGENAPELSILIELSRLLGVSIDGLLGVTSDYNPTFQATVFCTSLNGFAEKAATNSPRDVADMANGVFFTLTEVLLRYDGVPVKYVGDGFLGFFAGVDHQKRAIQAALSARKLVTHPGLVVAMHTGEIYLGTIGHPDYARPDIIGQTVNTAFLMMPVVAKQFHSGIGLTDQVVVEEPLKNQLSDRGLTQIQGLQRPIQLFELSLS